MATVAGFLQLGTAFLFILHFSQVHSNHFGVKRQTVQHRVTMVGTFLEREGKKDICLHNKPSGVLCWPLMPDGADSVGLQFETHFLDGPGDQVTQLTSNSFHPPKTHSAKEKLRSQGRRKPVLKTDEETKKLLYIGLRNQFWLQTKYLQMPTAESPMLGAVIQRPVWVGLWSVWVDFCIRHSAMR